MPPTLMLVICIIFVACLLVLEHKRSPGVSKAVWIPTLWMLYCSSRPVSYWLQTGITEADMSVESGNPLERAILSIFIAFGLIILANRTINWQQTIKDNRWLIVLFAYMLISILWSDFPFVSFRRWVKTAGTVIMALVLLSESRPWDAMYSTFIRTVYVLIPFSAVLVKYFPAYGVVFGRWTGGTMWLGATMAKNCLGVLCLMSALFLIPMLVRRWQGVELLKVRYQTLADLLILGLTFWLMKGPGGSFSATSTIVLVLGLITFFTLRRLNQVKHMDTVVRSAFFGTVVVLLLVEVLEVSPTAIIASIMGRDETLTGRSDLIWSVLVPIAWKTPLFGVGYGGFWVVRPDGFDFDATINEAHNGYLDVFIELGAVGLVFLLFLVTSYYWKARKEFERNQENASFRLAVLLIVLIHNFTETDFLRSTLPLWNLFVFLMVVYPKTSEQEKEIASLCGLGEVEPPSRFLRSCCVERL